MFYKTVLDGCVLLISPDRGETEISEAEYCAVLQKIRTKPQDPDGFRYQLRDGTLEWELTECPPEPEEGAS